MSQTVMELAKVWASKFDLKLQSVAGGSYLGGYEACAKELGPDRVKCTNCLAGALNPQIDKLKADLAAKDAEIEKWKSTCGRYNSDNAGTLAQLDTLKETNRLLVEALKEYERQVAILYVSNWEDQKAMSDLVYKCPKALADLGEVST